MNSLQKKIWALATVILFIMVAIWISLTYYNQKTQNQYNDILERYLSMNEVSSVSQQMVTDLNNYLLNPSFANLEALQLNINKLQNKKDEVSKFRNNQNDFALTNYENLIDSLIEATERSLLFRTEKETEDYLEVLTEATHISKYISEMTLTLIDKELNTYDRFYRGIIEQSEELKKLGIWLLLLITLLLVQFTYWFSLRITRPVKKLTQAAIELSKGRFNSKIEVDSNDEISFLAKMFDRMRININNFLLEVQQNAQLENELKENKLLLQESQLHSLQSQMNPHFLYNTLNTLSKKAYMEGSEETSDLIVSVASLLRYNLKSLDKSTTLAEEVNILQQYIDIQKARFTERLQFHMNIDEKCLGLQIPRLTLQPIIENAVIHAIEPKEEGGIIWFRAINSTDEVTIEIEDDGPGMNEHKRKQILEGNSIDTEGHSTGIGMSNVGKRLRLFYGYENIMDIESTLGIGTKVVLKIPKKRRIEKDDETPNR
ncbi:sensor histidine kinase [Cytobacillus sp. IB215316]|uniref:sensor histidine kinase n=1 Tax=Cytobacillus sp. IB215316 TaxID=3097354 RepID=UPI002A184733|nr:histidine kinase [Cytobacillus sp. IB215316]MDX8360960.1 histidine kinase [Cytobacillus sp. IB215316]